MFLKNKQAGAEVTAEPVYSARLQQGPAVALVRHTPQSGHVKVQAGIADGTFAASSSGRLIRHSS